MKFGVVVFPGSNCDVDVYYLLRDVLEGDVEYIWHKESELHRFDAIILPGGFSYGDYLRPGAIARFSPVMQSLQDFVEKGKLVLGICNGFQILAEAEMLPGAFCRNTHLQFRCSYVYLKVENTNLPFTREVGTGQLLQMPVANADGNYYVDEVQLKNMHQNGQVVFRYVDKWGENSPAANPSGALANIAGVCNKRGNVLGMMPHPERAADTLLGSEDGLLIFDSMLKYLAAGKG